jgi:hypothetical protein
LVSKKLPPLKVENAEVLVCAVARLLPNPPKLAKASFCGLLGGLLGVGEDPKLRLLKASLSPPTDPGAWWPKPGDCIPPKEGEETWEVCCCGGCGRGAVAYSDRMDCFKSGRD